LSKPTISLCQVLIVVPSVAIRISLADCVSPKIALAPIVVATSMALVTPLLFSSLSHSV